MRWMVWLAGSAAVLWGGLWYGGSVAIQRGAEDWFRQQAAQGLTAEQTALSVSGFPGRFDLGIEGLRLADPASGTGWQAPAVHIHAQSWRPWRITADLPPDQTVTLPDQRLDIGSVGLTATLAAAASTDLPLAEVAVSGQRLTATSDAGWTLGLGDFAAALVADPAGPAGAYRLTFDLAPLTPDPAFHAAVQAVSLPDLPAPDFPAAIDTLAGTVLLAFSAPLDRHSGETNPQLTRIEIAEATLVWGALSLSAKGVLTADAEGLAEGRIDLALTNWNRLPALLVGSGLVLPGVGTTIGNMLKALAAQSPDLAVLALPLDLKAGRMSLGPFPLGPAPRLRTP